MAERTAEGLDPTSPIDPVESPESLTVQTKNRRLTPGQRRRLRVVGATALVTFAGIATFESFHFHNARSKQLSIDERCASMARIDGQQAVLGSISAYDIKNCNMVAEPATVTASISQNLTHEEYKFPPQAQFTSEMHHEEQLTTSHTAFLHNSDVLGNIAFFEGLMLFSAIGATASERKYR